MTRLLSVLLVCACLLPGRAHAGSHHHRRHHRVGAWVPLVITAYSWGCGASGSTASGQWPYVGGAAAYPYQFGFGTRLTIPGLWTVTVNDVGGGIGWGHLDVFMGSCFQAIQWGVRTENVLVWR